MQLSTLSRPLIRLAAITFAAFASALPALAISVTVNGQTIALTPPPIERAGRVFVPLRGVFEELGASVVYEAGIVNANGNGRAISFKIGSNEATIGGSRKPSIRRRSWSGPRRTYRCVSSPRLWARGLRTMRR